MNKEEYEHKMAEIKANHTSAEARAINLIKPVLIGLLSIFTIAFVIMMFQIGNETQADTVSNDTPVLPKVDEKEAIKWQSFEGVTDCQLAYNIHSDYSPIMTDLKKLAARTGGISQKEAVNWKQGTRFDERLARLSNKYPSSYTTHYPNALIAHGMDFAIGQYWRDIYFHAKSDRIGNPVNSKQPQLMQDDLKVLKSECPDEFRG